MATAFYFLKMRSGNNIEILKRYLPEESVEKVLSFLSNHKVLFKITSHRNSKFGDFCAPNSRCLNPKISINGDLNRYMFLTVFLHEAAHLLTWQKFKSSVKPHGREWQACHQELLLQYLPIYPEKLRPFVLKYCRKIPISSIDVVNLERALQNYNKEVVSNLLLMDLSFGDQFVLQSHPDDIFEIQSKRRTRYVCRALSSGKLFLIKGAALVIKIES